jgi:putative heme-binding domain-containing protein
MLAARTRPEDRRLLLQALDAALAGGSASTMPKDLREAVLNLANEDSGDALLARLSARFGSREARERFVATATNTQVSEALRLEAMALLADLGDTELVLPLRSLAVQDLSPQVRLAALRALGKLDQRATADVVVGAYPTQDAAWRRQALDVLLGRKDTARKLLEAIDRGRIDARDVPLDQVSRVTILGDSELDDLVHKHWGRVTSGTPEEKLAEVRRLNNDLRAAPGNPVRGQALFRKHCGSCHRLFDEGTQVGPELTHANRKDRDFLLVSLVDPNAVIRREYQSSLIHSRDGRVLTGLIAEQTPSRVTLVVSATERTTLSRDEIEAMTDSPASLMPENLYREFSPEALRDLFAYLQADSPPRAEAAR